MAEAHDDLGGTERPVDRRDQSAAAPAVVQNNDAQRRDVVQEGRAAYADATERLDQAYAAIYYGTGTNDDKRAVEIERDNVARFYVALALAERPPPDPDDDGWAAVEAAEQIGVTSNDAFRIFVEDGEYDGDEPDHDPDLAARMTRPPIHSERVVAQANDEGAGRQQAELAGSTTGAQPADAAETVDQLSADLKAATDAAKRDAASSQHDYGMTPKPSPGRGGFGR
jgi:hypothetical protein